VLDSPPAVGLSAWPQWSGQVPPPPDGPPQVEASAETAPVAARTAPAPRRPIGLIAIDLDGTLLRDDKKLSTRSAWAIAKAVQQGIHVVLATARPPRSVSKLYRHLGLTTPLINYNGALIHDPRRGRHLFHQPIGADVARRVVRCARRCDRDVIVNVEVLDRWYTDHMDDRFPTETARFFQPDFVGPLRAFLNKPVTKLMLAGPPERLGRVRAAVMQKFAGQVDVVISDPYLIQVVHPRVDKAHALAHVARDLGVAQQNVMAIGDAPNDRMMLQWAGVGVAVANAWQEVQRIADAVVPSNSEDGVAHAIEHFALA
jgi:5-amino-6-(5-phospho-D-ribitylamino)uracil phosphatase